MLSNNTEYTITQSTRGKEILIHGEYIFNQCYTAKTHTSWKCKLKTCRSKLKTFLNSGYEQKQHNHLPNPDENVKILVNNSIKTEQL
jgi:hypothetical protein